MFSLVIPTYNERSNIASLIQKIEDSLRGASFEVIVVDDDSPDGTGELIEQLKKKYSFLRLIRRVSERGLSSAVLTGFLTAKGDILGVMDGDHSHDERLLPKMIHIIESGNADCVVGSRRIEGGGFQKWPWRRKLYSNGATFLARLLTGISVSDPMSGFFCVKRAAIEKMFPKFRGVGYKILLEILVKAKLKNLIELPYTFVDRKEGSSKLSLKVILEYISQLIELSFYRAK